MLTTTTTTRECLSCKFPYIPQSSWQTKTCFMVTKNFVCSWQENIKRFKFPSIFDFYTWINITSLLPCRMYLFIKYKLFSASNYFVPSAINILGGRLKPVTSIKVTLLHGCFSHFLNCTNGTKSRKAPHSSRD